MRAFTKFAVATTLAVGALAGAGSAGAVVVPFAGTSLPGFDPLGDAYDSVLTLNTGSLKSYYEMKSQTFNPLLSDIGDGDTWATIFQYTINNGYTGVSTLAADTYFTDITTGQSWIVTFDAASGSFFKTVRFTAPTGDKVSAGDIFEMKIGLLKPVAASLTTVKLKYGWSSNWDNTYAAVPEPATWALMVGGVGLMGASLRRNRRRLATTA